MELNDIINILKLSSVSCLSAALGGVLLTLRFNALRSRIKKQEAELVKAQEIIARYGTRLTMLESAYNTLHEELYMSTGMAGADQSWRRQHPDAWEELQTNLRRYQPR